MNKRIVMPFAAAALALAMSAAVAKDPMVGGAAMYETKDIVQNAMNSADHTTLVAAVKAAGLVETLETPGPFTVFAPTNEAFQKLPAGTVDTLLQPANMDQLKSVLTYHVVSGRIGAKELKMMIKQGNGTATLKTVNGEPLWAMMDGSHIALKDQKGNVAHISISNVYQSNGVIHVIDTVLMP